MLKRYFEEIIVSENDDRRVEARLGAISGGYNSSPDKIQEIQARAAEHERMGRPKPKRQFLEVLAKGKKPQSERELTEKEKKYASLPKSGPRPNGVAASFRAKLGKVQSDENVVLKG